MADEKKRKVLAVFDFDHTIINDNSDTWVVKLAPGGQAPDWLSKTYRHGYWTEYMENIFKYLHENGVMPDEILNFMGTIPYTDKIRDALKFIGKNNTKFNCIVISDSNTVFIETILKAGGVEHAINNVFSNPAYFDKSNCLHVKPYHKHACKSCPVNMCKKTILLEYIGTQAQDGVEYHKVVYVGDGGNDLCPCKELGGSDVVMPRKGYRLIKKLEKLEKGPSSLRAKVVPWESGTEVLAVLKDC